MPRTLSAAELLDTLDVDLWGNKYTMRQVTKSVSKRMDDAQQKLQSINEETVDSNTAAVALIGVVDVLLEPSDGAPAAADLLTGLWDEDKLGMDWLNVFSDALMEEFKTRRRPTSTQPSDG